MPIGGLVAAFPGLETQMMLWFEMNHYIENTSPERIAELQAVVDFNVLLIRATSEAGVTIFAGTDAAFVPGLAPNLSLHE